ncbi:MAG: stage III sporulation protein AC, partial [Clostridia bacterium]|nr:stage III sporulation protein AC [Clostridia bacterium]
MDIGLIMKIAGVGLLVAVVSQVLAKMGREEQATFVTLAGIVTVLIVLVAEIAKLFQTVRTVFG